MKRSAVLLFALMLSTSVAHAQTSHTILFVGNSFTYGDGSAVRFYRSNTVTDLNNEGIGGVPALFKSFAAQAGLSYDVFLETRGGAGFDFHLENKLGVINRRWDVVVPTTSRDLATRLHDMNRDVQIHLMATWSRADQVYPPRGAWHGKPIEAMARDIRVAFEEAANNAPGVKSVLPVGDAWTRAMRTGVADPNPYDGVDAGQVGEMEDFAEVDPTGEFRDAEAKLRARVAGS